jgi:anti-anti-sigma factor
MLSITRTMVANADGPAVAVLEVAGELDIATAPQLSTAINTIRGTGQHRIVLDLAGLDFCDAAGLGAQVAAQQRCAAAGGWITLARPRARMRWLLAIAGLADVLSCRPSVAQPCGC